MSILKTFEKLPGEKQDYDIRFLKWMNGFVPADSADNTRPGFSDPFTVEVPPGITLASSSIWDGVVKLWVLGGTAGNSYVLTVTLTTKAGRIKQAQIAINVIAKVAA